MKACEKGNEDIMGKLLAQFTPKDILASLTAQNKDGNTCLMKACATGNLKVIYIIYSHFIFLTLFVLLVFYCCRFNCSILPVYLFIYLFYYKYIC
jgi:Ankyrin repeats (many copies)